MGKPQHKLPCGKGKRETFRSGWRVHACAKSLQSCPTLCDPIDGSPTGSPVPGILQARTLEWVHACAKSLQLCPTLCDPMDCSPPGSSVHGILQARTLEWVPFPSPGDLSDPGIIPMSPVLQVSSLPLVPPVEKAMAPTPVFLPGESCGWRSLVGCSPWGR